MGGTETVVAESGGAARPLTVAGFVNVPTCNDAQGAALCSGMNEIGGVAKSERMRLSSHHHMGTGVTTRAETDRFMDGTCPELMHLGVDTGHIAVAGDDPLDLTKTYATRIGHVQLGKFGQLCPHRRAPGSMTASAWPRVPCGCGLEP